MSVVETPLNVTITREGADVVLALEGEIDLASRRLLNDCLRRAADDVEGALVVDLAGVTFMDSTALQSLIRARLQLEPTGRRVVVRNPTDAIRRIFDLTGITEAFGL